MDRRSQIQPCRGVHGAGFAILPTVVMCSSRYSERARRCLSCNPCMRCRDDAFACRVSETHGMKLHHIRSFMALTERTLDTYAVYGDNYCDCKGLWRESENEEDEMPSDYCYSDEDKPLQRFAYSRQASSMWLIAEPGHNLHALGSTSRLAEIEFKALLQRFGLQVEEPQRQGVSRAMSTASWNG